jgi:uncharacterized membrane protein YfcA
MSVGYIIAIIAIGFLAGFMSSMVGIGGGLIIVPGLVLAFGMSQKMAQGTSLAMLSLPVAAIGAYSYYKAGYGDWKVAGMLAVTFMIGGYYGGKVVVGLDTHIVKKIFAVFMIIIAIKYLFFDKPKPAETDTGTEQTTNK